MGNARSLKTLYGALILFSLSFQLGYFGTWVATRTIVGSAVAFMVIAAICWAGRRLNSGRFGDRVIQYVIGYTALLGARGKSKQLFALFVAYFGIGGIFNLPLMSDSTGFFLTMFPLTIGLIGITLPWVERECRDSGRAG
ncbi:hypothetical protein P8X24_06395 [Pyrococcus kukulkanii]|uniref:hypothetical protein n=1 Tax=Pyrococcus kukulkanii TaxID=1609559 RepID=UPI0035624FFF